jgi:NTE family protein
MDMGDVPIKAKMGLIMSGGGARAAYQVGVLKAIAQILPGGHPQPFQIICGASAGAINSTALAVYAPNFRNAVRRLEKVWANFQVHHVFRADTTGLLRNWLRWWSALFMGGMGGSIPVALLDRAPLRALLARTLPCERIQDAIDAGLLHAISIAASGYSSGQSVNFFQGADGIPTWRRASRVGCAARIGIDHLMASSAIPFLFEAVRINREHFGDGSMRQIAPTSPAIHFGADRILVIGVRQERNGTPPRANQPSEYPSLAQIGGHVLSSIFLDAMEADLERLNRINETLSLIPSHVLIDTGKHATLRRVDTLLIAPSQDIGAIAARHKHHFPRPMRFLMRGLGAYRRGGADLLSYLLFEKPYCRELIDLGYADAMRRREQVAEFFRPALAGAG